MFKQSKIILIGILFIIFSLGFADVIPHKISYQGKLLENGEPVDGSANLMFRILDPLSTVKWEEIHTGVPVNNGLYSVVLGSVTRGPIPLSVFDDDSELSLQILVNGIPLSPNTDLQSVPYAYKTEKSDNSNKLNGEQPDYYLDWDNLSNIPPDIADGDDTGMGEETDPTVPENIKDGIAWNEVSDRPTGLDDGDDVGITEETDPTVPANIKDGIAWSEVSDRPTGLDDGDNIGINSIDGVYNENGNVDLIAGENITITPNDGSNTIEISASSGSSFYIEHDVLVNSQSYVKDITTNLGHRPKIVEFNLQAIGTTFSHARWIDHDHDGYGMLSCIHTNENDMPYSILLNDVFRIGRLQYGAGDALDFKIETSDNMIRISIEQVWGSPTYHNILPYTLYAE